MVNDSIADMLTRIRNAIKVKHEVVKMPSTKIIYEIAKQLYFEGFIKNFEVISIDKKIFLLIYLKYSQKKQTSQITGLKRVSKPGLRIYVGKDKIPAILGNKGIAIISTSQGIVTNLKAKSLGIGGEILCYIW